MKLHSEEVLKDYLALWSDPSPQRDLELLDRLTTEQVRFRDPVNDIAGRDRLKALFRDASDSIRDATVRVDGIAWVDGRRAFIKWQYGGNLHKLRLASWQVPGMSEITFSAEGLVSTHEDVWDLAGGLFEHFPYVGWLFRRLRQRLRVT